MKNWKLTSCLFRMASAGDDGTIMVWNVAAGKQLFELQYVFEQGL